MFILAAVNLEIFLVGLAKIAFGILVGAVGIFVASRLLGRLLGWGRGDDELAKGNLAAGTLHASAIVALGLLAQHAVDATWSAMDLGFRGEKVSGTMVVTLAIYGLVHVGVSFGVGSVVLWFGGWLFNKLTRGVDEIAEVRKGNLAPALVLGAVLVVLAIVTAPGLQTALDGLLPIPELARDQMVAPS